MTVTLVLKLDDLSIKRGSSSFSLSRVQITVIVVLDFVAVRLNLPLGVEDVVSAVVNANLFASFYSKARAVLLGVPRVELIADRGTEAILVGLHELVDSKLYSSVAITGPSVGIVGHLGQLGLDHGLEDCGQGDVSSHLEGGAGGHFVAVLVDPVGELIVKRRGDRDALDHSQSPVGVLVAVDRSCQAELCISGRNLICDNVGVAAPAGVEFDALIDRGAHVEGQPIAARGLRVPAQESVGIVRDLLGNAGFFVQLSLSKGRTGVHGEIDAYGVSFGGGGVDLHLHLRGDPLGVDGEVARGHRAREHLVGGNGAILILKPSTEGVAFANWHETACVCA